MKKKASIFIILVLLIAATSMAQTFVDAPNIRVTFVNQNPDPVNPGDVVKVRFQIENRGQETTEDVVVELLPDYPFSTYSGGNVRNLGKLQGAQTGSDSRIVAYELKVDKNAVAGDTEIELRVQIGKNVFQVFTDNQFLIDIEGEPEVFFEVIESSEVITPNSRFNVIIDLKNRGSDTARDIKLISGSKDFVSVGTNLLFIKELVAGATMRLNLTFITGSSLSKDVHMLPITLEFKDQAGNPQQVSQNINIQVVNQAELSLKEVKITPAKIKPGDEITIQVRVENIGEGDADNVKLTLQSEIEGNKNAYIGRLESDDDSPGFFSGSVPRSGEIIDTLIITFEDDLGEHVLQEDIKYTVRGVSISSIIISILGMIILALISLLAFIWFYQRCKCLLQGKKCSHHSHLPKIVQKLFGKEK